MASGHFSGIALPAYADLGGLIIGLLERDPPGAHAPGRELERPPRHSRAGLPPLRPADRALIAI